MAGAVLSAPHAWAATLSPRRARLARPESKGWNPVSAPNNRFSASPTLRPRRLPGCMHSYSQTPMPFRVVLLDSRYLRSYDLVRAIRFLKKNPAASASTVEKNVAGSGEAAGASWVSTRNGAVGETGTELKLLSAADAFTRPT